MSTAVYRFIRNAAIAATPMSAWRARACRSRRVKIDVQSPGAPLCGIQPASAVRRAASAHARARVVSTDARNPFGLPKFSLENE